MGANCAHRTQAAPWPWPAAAVLHLRNAQPHTAGLSLSCRAVLGPCLEDEAEIPHQGYWTGGVA